MSATLPSVSREFHGERFGEVLRALVDRPQFRRRRGRMNAQPREHTGGAAARWGSYRLTVPLLHFEFHSPDPND